MPPFTKDEMLTELRTILLYEADHIRAAANDEIAAEFIGFSRWATDDSVLEGEDEQIPDFEYEEEEYSVMDPQKVDLERFSITSTLIKCFEFAFRPSLSHELYDTNIKQITFFTQGIPRVGTYGETRPFMTPDGYCQIVSEVAAARWRLEVEEEGTFTARELALLANMTEGAVRNAMTGKGEGSLKTVPGKKPMQVEWAEAERWLKGRRGFVRTPARPSQDQVLKDRLKAIKTAQELGALIWLHSDLLEAPGPHSDFIERTPTKVDRSAGGAASLNWPHEEVMAWKLGTFTFDAAKAQALAQALDFDAPEFVGKALEVSLRRDASGGDQR